MGGMRRLYGPVEFRSISAGSVIIGPEARMEVYGQSQGRPFKMLLKPRRVVVDLAAVLKGAKILLGDGHAGLHCLRAEKNARMGRMIEMVEKTRAL